MPKTKPKSIKKSLNNIFSFKKKKVLFFGLSFFVAAILLLILNFFAIGQFIHNAVQTAFAADLTAIMNDSGSDINLTSGSYTFTGDLTIPQDKTLHFERGAIIVISPGQTLNIAGGMDSPLYQIFEDNSGDLTKGVKFANGNIVEVKPEWWGATNFCMQFQDCTNALVNANSQAIEKAIHSHGDNNTTVIFSGGVYEIFGTIKLVSGVSLKGQPSATIGLYQTGEMFGAVEDDEPLQKGSIEKISFFGHGNRSGVYYIHFSRGTGNFTIRSCKFRNLTNSSGSVFIEGGNNITIENNFFSNGSGENLIFHSVTDSRVVYNEDAAGGMIFENSGNIEIRGNINFNDWARDGRSAVKLTGCHDITIMNNRLGPYEYGITIRDSSNTISKNNFISLCYIHGIYTTGTVSGTIIRDNNILTSGYSQSHVVSDSDGIFTEGIFNGGSIENNRITGWKAGPISFNAQPSAGNSFPVVQNNQGVDTSHLPRILESIGDPDVLVSSRWKTDNESPIAVTDFKNAPTGKKMFIEIGDGNTTFDFSDNPHLLGNNGADWTPSPGDHMWCEKAGSYWSCNCFDNTP